MNRLILSHPLRPVSAEAVETQGKRRAVLVLVAASLLAIPAAAQITVNTKTGAVTNDSNGKVISNVDRRYQQITPTKVALSTVEINPRTRLEIMRLMQA